jgi:hypothetical protein
MFTVEERKERQRLSNRAYYARNREKACAYRAKYRAENPEKVSACNAAWREENPEIRRESARKTRAKRVASGLNAADTARRRAAKLARTPPWVDHGHIKTIYQDCPEGYQVDHIIPLQGELVSGLHVPWNLQHLPASENCSKNNRFDIEAYTHT